MGLKYAIVGVSAQVEKGAAAWAAAHQFFLEDYPHKDVAAQIHMRKIAPDIC